MTEVTAVVVGSPSSATLRALTRQTRPAPHRTATGLAEALTVASTGWLWLVDAEAEPEPEALERLVDAIDTPGDLPNTTLLSSLPVDARGAVLEGALPRGDEAGTQRLLQSVPHALVPIVAAPLTSLLVDVAAARVAPAPEPDRFGPFTARAWTGKLLAGEPGYLVLASRVRVAAPRARISALPAIARLGRDRLLTPGETVRAAAQTLSRSR